MTTDIVLASTSPFRRELLANAGVPFRAEAPHTDERAVEEATHRTGVMPGELAAILAEAKAQDVSGRNSGALVIGCDQVLSMDDRVLHKVADMEGARRRLLELSGRTHELSSAVAVVRDGETLWRHVSVARMTMRSLDPGFVGRHLARVGDRALASVGAYQVEGEGIQLFSRIEGDHYAIIGLPLLPLLDFLRASGAIDA